MHITPKRLIIDLLSTAPNRGMPPAALVAAAGVFGVTANNVRVTLARLRAAGMIDQSDDGRYRLARAAAAVAQQVAAWRTIEQRVRRWTGSWIAVHTAAVRLSDRRAHRHSRRALRLLGFEAFDAGLFLRPDNLVGGVAHTRAQLYRLGLDAKASVFVVSDLDDAAERRARQLWDGLALRQAYGAALRELAASARRLPAARLDEALVESFVLGGRVLRQLILDPLLPEPLVTCADRRALVEAMTRYDRLGRACWAAFLTQAEARSMSSRGEAGAHNAKGRAA